MFKDFSHMYIKNIRKVNLEPLSPSVDHYQISPNNINAQSRRGHEIEITSGEIS